MATLMRRISISGVAAFAMVALWSTSSDAGGLKDFLKRQGKTVADLTPAGWKVAQHGMASGDLNKDSIDDLAVVFETATKKHGTPKERVLVIALGSAEGAYVPLLANDRFILKKSRSGEKDPFDGIEILHRVLQVDFSGALGWDWDASYKFRFDNGDFYLIGSEHHSTQQSDPSNEYHLITYYPTSKYEVTKPRRRKELIALENPKKLKLREVGPARTFEPHVKREGLAHTR
jgi:hypothetical protein